MFFFLFNLLEEFEGVLRDTVADTAEKNRRTSQ